MNIFTILTTSLKNKFLLPTAEHMSDKISRKASYQESEQREGWLCGALFWKAPEDQEVQEVLWAQEVLEDQEDLCKEERTISKLSLNRKR